MKTLALLMAIASFALASTPASAQQHATELFFVSTVDELGQLQNVREPAKGIAISVPFYMSLAPKTRRAVETLVAHYISLKYRPVFLYGGDLDEETTEALLGTDASHCIRFIGLFPTMDQDGEESMRGICSGIETDTENYPQTEEEWRAWVTELWDDWKNSLRDRGYKVLD